MNTPGLSVVTARSEIEAIRRFTEGLVHREPPGFFTLRKCANWVAVPVESAMHFGAVHIQWLLSAFELRPGTTLWAASLEPRGGEPTEYRLPASQAGLLAFNRECGQDNFLLAAQDGFSAVVCTTDDYFVLTGPPDFVAAAAGGSLAGAFKTFQAYVELPVWDGRARNVYRTVLEALRDEYPDTPPGGTVTFPKPYGA
jgi:hypothetical protein